MVAPPFYKAYYGINTNCYDLCSVRQSVFYSIDGVVKLGAMILMLNDRMSFMYM